MLHVLRSSPTLDATEPNHGGCSSPNNCKRCGFAKERERKQKRKRVSRYVSKMAPAPSGPRGHVPSVPKAVATRGGPTEPFPWKRLRRAALQVRLQSPQDKRKRPTATGEPEARRGKAAPDRREASSDVWTESPRPVAAQCGRQPPRRVEPADRDSLRQAPTVPASRATSLCCRLTRVTLQAPRWTGAPRNPAPGTTPGSARCPLCTGCARPRSPPVRPVVYRLLSPSLNMPLKTCLENTFEKQG